MLRFILGRAGSGKTTYLRNLLTESVDNGENGIVMVVPEQFSFDTERELLNKLGSKKLNGIDILSFSRMSQILLEKYGGINKQHLDDSGRIILMSMAIDGVKDSMKIYRRLTENASFISNMLKLTSQMKQCGISPPDLKGASQTLKEGLLKEKTEEIALIMSAYDTLVEKSFYDDKNALTLAESVLHDNNYFNGKTVAIDAFKGFTKQELNIISCILKQAKDVYITLTTDDLYDKENGLNVFSHTKKTAQKIVEIAKRDNIAIATPIKLEYGEKTRFKSDELKLLENSLFNASSDVYTKNTDDILLYAAKDLHSQCEYVACTIKKLMREELFRCRDIAVIARNIDNYRNELQSAFRKYGIPYFEDNRQPINNQPIIRFVKNALKIADTGFTFESVMAYLKTGLTGISIEEVSEVENYALVWKINGKAWLKEWENHPDGYGQELHEEDLKTIERLNVIRKKIVGPLLKFTASCKDTNGEKIANSIYELLKDTNADANLKDFAIKLDESGSTALAKEQSKIWDILMNILDQTAATIGGCSITIKKYRELFNTIISKEDLGSIPYGLDEVTVGGADRIRVRSPRAVFVLGVNDGEFPKSPKTNGIFNSREINTLTNCGLEINDSYEYMVAEERFIAYNSLCSASEKLYVLYSLFDLAGNSLTPSVIVTEIKRIFPSCIESNIAYTNDEYYIEAEKPAFEIMARNYRNQNEIFKTLEEYFKDKSEYGNKLKTLKRIAEAKPMKIEDREVAQKLFGKNMYVSASRVETYYKCAFSYFCKYGIKAKPRKSAELDSMQIGNIIHYVLEQMLKKCGHGIIKLSDAEREKMINVYLSEYLESKMGGKGNKEKRFLFLFNRFSETVGDIIKRLVKELENSSFFPADFELKIDNDGDVPAYSLKLNNGGTLKIRGSIDRVDLMELDGKSYVRIIDYKSGEKKFDLSDVLEGLNMQMLIYLMGLWENGEERYENIVPSGILYVPAKQGKPELDRNATSEETEKTNIKNGKMSGFVLDDSRIISGMEKDVEGRFIPVSRNSSGKLSGDLISFDELKKLKNRADVLLKQMGEMLQDGEIPVLPVSGKNHEDDNMVCKWCDYKSVCGFEDGDKTRKIKKMSFKDSLATLDGEVNADE